MRVALQQELEQLEQSITDEADLVIRALAGSIKALSACDIVLADEVIEFDDVVDAAHLDIRRGVEELLARQTPVAVDLRLTLALLDINSHLERMADYCVTIAKLTKLTCELNSDTDLIATFEAMAGQATLMIRTSIESFSHRDVESAEALVEMDTEINRANRKVVHRVLGLGSDEQLQEWGMRMIVVSRCLERIGDHAVDIGEQTAYLVTGEIREFTDAST